MTDQTTSSGNANKGIFTTLLFITFLVLKLTSVIDWSWWWVTAPLWGPLALVIIILLIGWITCLIKNAITKRRYRRRKKSL